MMAQETEDMFNFRYEKSADEIKDKAAAKIKSLEEMTTKREARVAKLRKENDISDMDMAGLYEARHRQGVLQQGSYSFSNSVRSNNENRMEERSIAASVVNGIFTEKDAIAADAATIKKLNTISRNIRPLDRITPEGKFYKENGFQLSESELEFLGF